jgi:hypothetical protein
LDILHEIVFAILALAVVGSYGALLWAGTPPERALAYAVAGGLVVGVVSRKVIGFLTYEIASPATTAPRQALPAATPDKDDRPTAGPN